MTEARWWHLDIETTGGTTIGIDVSGPPDLRRVVEGLQGEWVRDSAISEVWVDSRDWALSFYGRDGGAVVVPRARVEYITVTPTDPPDVEAT